jgi:hypothetical protein
VTAYQTIFEDSIDRHGLVTTVRARELGLPSNTLALLAHRGRLVHVGHGVYRLAVPLPFAGEAPAYALAVEQVGPEAVLWGESVLALLGLLPANPARIHVGAPGRLRRHVPDGIAPHPLPADSIATEYEGVRSQSVADALRACRGTVMPDRLLAAAKKARERGYLTAREFAAVRKEVAP